MQLLVQNQGNNNNNNNPPPVDNLARFLRLQPPVFSSSTEPIVADDWLRHIGRELTTAGCTDVEKVRFAAHQLDGPAAWWENFTTTYPVDTVTWAQFQQAFRTAHVPTGAHPVDPTAEYVDAIASSEPGQQQQQPAAHGQPSPFSKVTAAGVFQ